jgi:hypothetical protein
MSTNEGLPMGAWVLPSGNTCDAVLTIDENGIRHILFAWDDPPPLSPADESFYRRVVIPEVAHRVLALTGVANVAR